MTKKIEVLIKAYQEFAALYTEIEPILASDVSIAISFSQYIRNFCLAMIVRVDADNLQHRDFVNNLTLITLPEMDEEEYRHAVTAYGIEHYDEFLFQRQTISQALLSFDLEHNTHHMKTFVNQVCVIGNIFASQNISYSQKIQEFIYQFKNCADLFIRSGGKMLMNGKSAVETGNVLTSDNGSAARRTVTSSTEPNQVPPAQNKQVFSPGPTVDGQYWLRVITPFIAMLAFIIGAIISEEWVLILIAIVPLCFFVAGLKAAQRRCPNCGAWDSMVTVRSKCIGQKKVKVRRNLHSSYYRTSGTHTYGSRQVFVSADEYTYNEEYRCNVCGHQTSGIRRAIDDGIR